MLAGLELGAVLHVDRGEIAGGPDQRTRTPGRDGGVICGAHCVAGSGVVVCQYLPSMSIGGANEDPRGSRYIDAMCVGIAVSARCEEVSDVIKNCTQRTVHNVVHLAATPIYESPTTRGRELNRWGNGKQENLLTRTNSSRSGSGTTG